MPTRVHQLIQLTSPSAASKVPARLVPPMLEREQILSLPATARSRLDALRLVASPDFLSLRR